MAIVSPATPFQAPSYQLSPSLELAVLKPVEAAQAGVLCASMDPWARYPVSAAELTGFFSKVEPGVPRFAIRVDGVFDGVITIKTNWFSGPYIQTFALAPVLQGRGIGSAVMAFIEREARAAQSRNLWVAASDFNAGALRFYERIGYHRLAEIDSLLRDNRTEILMRKKLFASPQPR